MGRKPAGSVYRRCGCRDGKTGRWWNASCPKLAGDRHGTWYFSFDLPRHVGEGRRRLRRGGYASREDAMHALEQLSLPGRRVVTVADWLEA